MGKKIIVIVLTFIILITICMLIGFYYHDKIESFINSETWTYINSYQTIKDTSSNSAFGNGSLGVCTSSGFSIYSKGSLSKKEDFISSNVIHCSCGSYTVLYAKDVDSIYLIKDTDIIWKKELSVEPKLVFVNKNGYVSIIFSQSGYKSGIKVFETSGKEVLTNYLATTYAVYAEVSTDNKNLYIAQVDTAGIKPVSSIKSINIASQKEDTIKLPDGQIVTDVKYISSNNMLVQTDSEIIKLNIDTKETLQEYKFEALNVIKAYINDYGMIFMITNDELSQSANRLIVIKGEDTNTIDLKLSPQSVCTYDNKAALNFGDEVWVTDNSKVLFKIKIDEALKEIRFINFGNDLALVYRSRIEIVKLRK